MTLPPLPPWEGAHVLIVHFPVGLLLVAPLFILLAMLLPRVHGLALAAWLLLFVGTVAAWVAVASGHAAFEDVGGDLSPAAIDLLHQHAHMGVNVRNMFTGLCLAYGLVLLIPRFIKRLVPVTFRIAGSLVILALYAFAALYLANTAQAGGTLVHTDGVRANLNPQTAPQ